MGGKTGTAGGTPGRGWSARGRAGTAGLAVLAACVAGFAFPGTAMAASNASATTTFHAHPDSGNHGNWADDDFTRTASVTFVAVDPTLADCGAKATSRFTYEAKIADFGSFFVISGASSPQAGGTGARAPSRPYPGGPDVTCR